MNLEALKVLFPGGFWADFGEFWKAAGWQPTVLILATIAFVFWAKAWGRRKGKD